MKKLFRYLNIATLFIALSAIVTSCKDFDGDGSGNSGLNIKVFAPTTVAPGYSMTINGSGFGNVTEIIFPGDIVVENFEIVTNEMIRVKAPEGLKEGGKLMVRNKDGETAESRLPLEVGGTVISGYSVEPGDTINGNDAFSIYGKDLQFITGVEFIDENDSIVYIGAVDFIRLAPGRAVVHVPAKVKDASYPVKIYLCDGRVIETPEFWFVPSSNGGHFEYKRRFLWENEDRTPLPGWGGLFRIGLAGNDPNNECIATVDQASWDLIKDGKVYFLYDGNESSNVRITTGWWSSAYGGPDHNCIDFSEEDTESDYRIIELNISKDANIHDLIDAQHLLFTGDAYTPIGIFVVDEIWVEGEGHYEVEKTTFWENGTHSTIPAPNWSSEGRFASVSHTSGEETWAFPEDQWEMLKNEEFLIKIQPTEANPNVRITTGWWSTNYGGGDYNCFEIAEENEDGTYTIALKLSNYQDLLDLVDAQHLLFTGSGYKLLEIYKEELIWVGGDAGPQEVVIWEGDGSAGAIDWNGTYRFGLDGNDGNNECIATLPAEHWDVIKNGSFFLHAKGSDWVQMRITTGWWSTTWTGADITTGDERIISNDDGTYDIEINFKGDPILDVLDAQHLLFTGGGYTPLKLYYVK